MKKKKTHKQIHHLQKELSEVTNIMHQSLEDILGRGEKVCLIFFLKFLIQIIHNQLSESLCDTKKTTNYDHTRVIGSVVLQSF